jgi:hypothetical protein
LFNTQKTPEASLANGKMTIASLPGGHVQLSLAIAVKIDRR